MTQTPSDIQPAEKTEAARAIALSETGKLAPKTQSEMWWFAKQAVESGLAPKDCRTPADAFIRIQLGAELGLPPMQAIQGIAVINGRPCIWGDCMLAVCLASPVFDHDAFNETFEGDDKREDTWVATCTVRRVGRERSTTRTFSYADAKRAGLWGKQGPWTNYPKRMLQMRARSFALRDTFADRTKGMYTAEEAGDMPPKHVEVTVSTPAAPAPTSRTAALAASLAAPAGPPPEVVAQIEALRQTDEPEVPDVQPDPDHEVRRAMFTEIRMKVAGCTKTGLSRIRKDFGLVLFDDDALGKLSDDDLASLRDALNGEQTEAQT